ncbi:MAG: transporter substrate-binding domain-containing protein, partial [Lachnospiraceae bacterium]|nr:transporter substrate-binding domain-containing protein [Lachnospiraceae bacterium]
VANGQIAGTDPDIAVRFCREYGYGIEIHIVDTAGIIPGIVTGMYDFALSDMVVTEERKESVSFSVPYHGTELMVMTRKDAADAATNVSDEKTGALSDLASSFSKTFLREDRWKLFLEGIGNTMVITLLSIFFGTALGFLVFMLCRNGNILANGVTRFCIWLVTGTPMVVLLMILYYIIFAKSTFGGAAVAVIGFTLVFASSVYAMLCSGVSAVDRGQTEAAYAMGYGNTRTFFRIILPQAVPHFLPSYKGEMVSLIKATAVVGYIAVQDLTKMGDIVRGRTYEAFFPLIAVAVIYFILAGILTALVSRIELWTDPKRRSKESILEGVNTHD